MKEAYSPETQFSIYKINYDAVEAAFTFHSKREAPAYADEVTNALVNSIVAILNKRPRSTAFKAKYRGFSGVFFKTIHDPNWKDVAKLIISGNEYKQKQQIVVDDFLTNANVSYVLLHAHDKSIFAVTGGYGSNYITKFTEKNFGLYLLPKIVKRDNPVLKAVVQNNLTGNQTSMQKTNRKSTSFIVEQDMSSIFRQLNVEADKEIAQCIGIEFDENEAANKIVNIVNKDSLVIRRSLSLSQLKRIIGVICKLENKPDQFALNYLVKASKKGIKNAQLYEKLINDFVNCDFSRFILVGDDYETYYFGASQYIIKDESDDAIVIEQTAPISFGDVIHAVMGADGKITKHAVVTMLKKWVIFTKDNSGNQVLFPIQIFDAIQGFVEYGPDNSPCYLFNGNWYVFDKKYSQLLDDEYTGLYESQHDEASNLSAQYGLQHKATNEEAYNMWLYSKRQVMVAHTVLFDNVEIADAIFWNDDTLFLMHNKAKFTGIGTRDLTNQVMAASEYLQKRLASTDRTAFVEDYYDKVSKKYTSKGSQLSIEKAEFLDLFSGKRKIHYVLGYLYGFSKKSLSTYAKYLTVELVKRLASKGYACTIVNLSE